MRDTEPFRRLFAALAIGVLTHGLVGCDDDIETSELQKPPAVDARPGPNAQAGAAAEPPPAERGRRAVTGQPSDPSEEIEEPAAEDDPSVEGRRVSKGRRSTGAKRRTAKARRPSGRARAQSGSGAHGPEPGVSPGLNVRRLVVSRGIENREPIGELDHLTLDRAERVYAFVELTNPAEVTSQVQVRFVSPSGQPIDVLLEVGDKPRWRTWAYTRKVRQTGTWTVMVRGTDGAELASTRFEVTQ